MFDPGEARPGFDGQRDGAEQTSCLQPHPGWVGDESVKDRETGREIINCQSVSQSVSQAGRKANYRIEMFIEGRADRGITDIYK